MASLSPLDFYLSGPGAEGPHRYRPGGYHPVHLGDLYHQRYRIIHKLGFGSYSTVWLARDLQSAVQTRYVTLKFAVAELTGKNNEIKIHRHLASRSGAHPGSNHVLTLLDHFKVKGVNGEHDVLVFPVIGPPLEIVFRSDPTLIQQSIKSVMHQVALGTSFLHYSGVVHGDLHKNNIAFEIPDFDGKPERDVLRKILGLPECGPVFTLDQSHQTESLPKYLVLSGDLMECVNQGDLRVKILDLGEAFFIGQVPRELYTPIQVRAPEIIFNNLSTLLKIEYGTRIDAWSVGCLIYELATMISLIDDTYDEDGALHNLTTTLGPLPKEWMDSIGTLHSCPGRDISLEQRLQSFSRVDDTSELIELLQQILVFDPVRRPEVSDFLHHPWFSGSPSPITSSKSPSERLEHSLCTSCSPFEGTETPSENIGP